MLTLKGGIEVRLCASVCVCVFDAPCTECYGIQTMQSYSDKGAHRMLGVLAPQETTRALDNNADANMLQTLGFFFSYTAKQFRWCRHVKR